MKKIRKIILTLLVINLILFTYLLFLKPIKIYTLDDYMEMNYSNGIPANEIVVEEDSEIYFGNMDELINTYKGELGVYNLTRKFGELIYHDFKDFYIATAKMSKTQISSYFNENKSDIALKTGLTDADTFSKLIDKLQIYKDGTLTYKDSAIVKNTVEVGQKYTTFDYVIDYTNDKSIQFKVYFSNKDNIDTPIIIIEP